jgi:hypothetical protein
MHRPEGEFSTSTFIASLCVDANGDMQLADGDSILELRFADDQSPEALRQVRIDMDETELGP